MSDPPESPADPPRDDLVEGGDRATVVMAEEAPRSAEPSREEELAEARKLIGRVISKRYRIVEMIAAGGMGAVFRGEHVHMRHRVAIKVLLPHTEGLPDLVERFEREAIAGAHIRHPNVAAATDFGRDEDGNYFLVLEYARGETLSEVMSKGPMAPERAVRIVSELAAALEAVHEKGIVHRDVKPKNVVLSEEDGSVKLLDFGFAKLDVDRLSVAHAEKGKAASDLTAVGIVLGTVPYMAPEISRGMAALDARADLYALGIIFYELLAGKHPFEAKTQAELFAAQCLDPPPPLAVRSPGIAVAPALEAVVMTLLAKKPEERFQSAAATLAALEAAAKEPAFEPASEPVPPALSPPARRAAALPAPSPPRRRAAPVSAPKGVTALFDRGLTVLRRMPPVVYLAGAPALLVTLAIIVALSGTENPSAAEPGQSETKPSRAERGEDDDAADARPAAVGGIDSLAAAEWRRKLLAAPRVKHWVNGAQALTALAKIDPRAFEEREIQQAAASVAVGAATGDDALSDPVFEALASELGEAGLVVLFEIVRTKGGTKAQVRALELLRSAEVAERASPGLRLAFELRTKPCADKRALFVRAGEEGDARTLQELEILAHAKCQSEHHGCCFRDDADLKGAIAALRGKASR